MFSNKYIFVYSTILVVVSAAILTLAAVGLKPFQQKNIRVEKMQQLLSSVGVDSNTKNAEDLFEKYFLEEYAVNKNGEIVGSFAGGEQILGSVRPFNIEIKGSDIMPVYVCSKGGKKIYVVPVTGTGLWGGIWGNIALADDLSTIVGVNFDHKSETPGLGAEIAQKPFQSQFKGKTIFDNDNQFSSVEVIKRADKTNPHQVDAISGGTITSNAVSDMLKNCLGFYVPYFNSLKK